ncbi:unnamed protein product [Gadus morhua 'NCC']
MLTSGWMFQRGPQPIERHATRPQQPEAGPGCNGAAASAATIPGLDTEEGQRYTARPGLTFLTPALLQPEGGVCPALGHVWGRDQSAKDVLPRPITAVAKGAAANST